MRNEVVSENDISVAEYTYCLLDRKSSMLGKLIELNASLENITSCSKTLQIHIGEINIFFRIVCSHRSSFKVLENQTFFFIKGKNIISWYRGCDVFTTKILNKNILDDQKRVNKIRKVFCWKGIEPRPVHCNRLVIFYQLGDKIWGLISPALKKNAILRLPKWESLRFSCNNH